MLKGPCIYITFTFLFFWLPSSHAFSLSCRKFLRSQPPHSYAITGRDIQYKLLWINDNDVLNDSERKYLDNEREWVDCTYDERAYVINGNFFCGERKLRKENGGLVTHLFDKNDVAWRVTYLGRLGPEEKDCQVLNGGKTLISERTYIFLFKIFFNNNKHKYFFMKDFITEEVEIYYPEF